MEIYWLAAKETEVFREEDVRYARNVLGAMTLFRS
jgi:hypothetical protein